MLVSKTSLGLLERTTRTQVEQRGAQATPPRPFMNLFNEYGPRFVKFYVPHCSIKIRKTLNKMSFKVKICLL